jgi:hypothetical protein
MDWRMIEIAPHHEPILCTTEELLMQGQAFVCRWATVSDEHWQEGFYTLQDGVLILFEEPTMFQYLH